MHHVEHEPNARHAWTDGELRQLRSMIAEHARLTGSPVAEGMLADWDAALKRFVKIMPTDYKRALAILATQGSDL